LVGGGAGPTVSSISYDGSIWQGAAGGFTTFTSVPPPSQILDPSVSLNVGGQAVAGSGTLTTLLVDVSGYPVGSTFDLDLTGTVAGDTAFSRSGSSVAAIITNGSIHIIAVPEPAPVFGMAGAGVLALITRRANHRVR
jgi:hypothetical protein